MSSTDWLDEQLWKLQVDTQRTGYDPNHRQQQIHRNTIKTAILQKYENYLYEARIDQLKKDIGSSYDSMKTDLTNLKSKKENKG